MSSIALLLSFTILQLNNIILVDAYFCGSFGTIIRNHQGSYNNIFNSIIGGGYHQQPPSPPIPPSNRNFQLYASKNDNESQSSSSSSDSSIGRNSDSCNNSIEPESKNPIIRYFMTLPEETRDDIKSTALSFSIALFVRLVLFEPRYIPSLSMFPTFDVGDQLLVDKVVSRNIRGFQRRDVVVFNPSETYTDMTGNTEALIKRIIGLPGDVIEVRNNNVYVNGLLQEEPYTNEHPNYNLSPLTVPAGQVLVLGDNRNKSFDSHVWGFLPERNIIGRAVLKYWPPWRAGFVEGSL